MTVLCLLALACVVSISPQSVGAAASLGVRGTVAGMRHPPMMHTRFPSPAGSGVVVRGRSVGWSPVLQAPPPPSSVDEATDGMTGYDGGDDEGAVETDEAGAPMTSSAEVPRPDERRSPFAPHLLGPASSGGIRKVITTSGIDEEKRWAPTEIRMNEFIHKIQAVNAASRYNRRFYDPASNDYEWWARRVRRQRQQQAADGAKAAQALKLYGLRTRFGLEKSE